jgi:signal transduction histidine kinase
MKRFAARNIYILIAIPVFLVLLICELLFYKENSKMQEAQRVSGIFENKEKRLAQMVDSVAFSLTVNPAVLKEWSLLRFFKPDEDGLAVAVFNEKALVFWSSSSIAFPPFDNRLKRRDGLVHLTTGWYYQITRISGNYSISGFLLIKREFPYHNRYIRSAFQKDFKLPDDDLLHAVPQSDGLNILKPDGTFIFSLTTSHHNLAVNKSPDFSALLYFVFLFFVLAQFNVVLKRTRRIGTNLKILISIGSSFLIYLIMNGYGFPASLYKTNLFSPRDFAFSSWLSSLGEFVLLSILMFHTALSLFIFSDRSGIKLRKGFWKIYPILFAAFFFTFSVALLKILLLNSNISLEFFSDLKFSAINFYAFSAISLQVFGFIILLWRLRKDYFDESGGKEFILLLFAAGIIAGIFVSLLCYQIEWMPFIYYVAVVLIMARFKVGKIREYQFTFLLIISIAGASYVNLYAQDLIQGKKNKVLDLWAVKLSSERDSGAEIFLSELDNKLRRDTVIQSHLFPPYKTLESYFQNNYFTGFWRNYNMQITVCNPGDSVYITDEKRHYPCLEFFDNLRKTKGMLVSGSNFYFMDRLNGRISYLGQLDFVNPMNIPVKIFIELNSKVIPEGKGYPELLLDERASRESRDGDYSYAKYFDGELVDRGGNYQYEMKLPADIPLHEEYTYFSKNGYRHCAYNRNGNNYVIVSYPEMYIYQRISTFPYLFLLFFLTGSILLIFKTRHPGIRNRKLDFRGKIQLTLILSLLGILVLIGIGLMLYNSRKLLNSVKDNLNEKLMSVSSELSLRIGQETELNPPMLDYMNEQLIVLSDIIRSDINLYDLKGSLFATSRSEIYDRGLLSRRINPVAFKSLTTGHKTLFLHNENLGVMNFFSAYSPVYNQNSKLIGYLNLPYFTRQDDFEKQVSDFIVAFSNLYIFLIIISLMVALIISHKLTAPLLEIENYLKGIQLGKANAKIEYVGEDEIGRLAKEYNKKVDELAESAELLARSERESAWQEMARQVAHEINNPLTPMKLSIQYLQRLKEQNSDNFDDYFFRVTRMLAEQIDALSLIASSFSDFAKMPMINNVGWINLREKLSEVVLLFGNVNNLTVSLTVTGEEPIGVIADKDQLGRAIINLIRNGMQAIPRDRGGVIIVNLHKDENWAYISVTDNGSGVPVELQDKLFEPSFTTKSSGMGLGLAIAKKIIENFNGEIWFRSTRDVETTFFIKLPLPVPS